MRSTNANKGFASNRAFAWNNKALNINQSINTTLRPQSVHPFISAEYVISSNFDRFHFLCCCYFEQGSVPLKVTHAVKILVACSAVMRILAVLVVLLKVRRFLCHSNLFPQLLN